MSSMFPRSATLSVQLRVGPLTVRGPESTRRAVACASATEASPTAGGTLVTTSSTRCGPERVEGGCTRFAVSATSRRCPGEAAPTTSSPPLTCSAAFAGGRSISRARACR